MHSCEYVITQANIYGLTEIVQHGSFSIKRRIARKLEQSSSALCRGNHCWESYLCYVMIGRIARNCYRSKLSR